MRVSWVGMVSLMGIVGCLDAKNESKNLEQQRPQSQEEFFRERLLDIAQTYETYGRYEWPETVAAARESPAACGAIIFPLPSPEAKVSQSEDTKTHGRKLYTLFVKKTKASSYLDLPKDTTGQVIVKESWVPELVKDGEPMPEVITRKVRVRPESLKDDVALIEHEDRWLPAAKGEDGKWYRAGKQAELFVMFQLPPNTPNTDDGWVYGNVSADRKTVLSVGRIESCMKCHENAPHGKLFGLPTK